MGDPRIGLVLGGGGARGFGHVAVLEALDELGLTPVAIAGASIGAIMGAGRARGMGGAEIRAASIETFRDNKAALARLWALRPRKLADMFSGRLGQFDPERLLDAFVGPFLSDTFEDLAIPLSVAATDFYGARAVTLRAGNLRQAIAASMALPSIFRPVVIDGRVLMDGGITNPVPVDDLPAVDLVIAVDVVALPEPREGREVPGAMESVFGATQLLMAALAEAKFAARPPDLLIRPPVGRFKVLDFLKAREILDACDAGKDDLKRRIARLVETTTLAAG